MKKKIILIIAIILMTTINMSGCFDSKQKSINRCVDMHLENFDIHLNDYNPNQIIINGTFIEGVIGHTYNQWFSSGITIKQSRLEKNKEYNFKIDFTINNTNLNVFGEENFVEGFVKFPNDKEFYIEVTNGEIDHIENQVNSITIDVSDSYVLKVNGTNASISIRFTPYTI